MRLRHSDTIGHVRKHGCVKLIRWMPVTKRILLCITDFSTIRNTGNAIVVIEKMHFRNNEFCRGGSNPSSIFSLNDT